MTATYTFDVFCTLDGYGSYTEPGDWGGYWGKQGPEFLDRRAEQFSGDHRMVFGANTFREFIEMIPSTTDSADLDPWLALMRAKPATVISSTVADTSGWPDATPASGDAAEIVRRLKDESDVPLHSHGSLSLNAALMAAGLVDAVRVTIFPVITGRCGTRPVFGDAGGFDLELLDSHVLDGRIQELTYRPTAHF
ncbi:dihydrofolate reductase family protein [Gordonia sp. 'Campus']|uniref:dihydrofolate reductase family protein n=1 Tax=Gordonia sp. 'Campus' TaxID=2915824 RepID=UPI001EE43EDD|nr:dihydrofolate reductase family protein [Gordonia sp. 'Campus']